MLEVNDWIIINSITYKIHSIEDFDLMRKTVMKQLSDLITFDSASFYITKSITNKELISPLGINYCEKDMLDYLKQFKNVDYSKGLMTTGKNIVYRESDIVSKEMRVNSEYYKKVYDTHNWHFSLHLNISFQEEFLGVLSFFRNKGKEDFSYEEIFVLEMIKDHLAFRLYKEAMSRDDGKFTLIELIEESGLSERESSVLELILEGDSTFDISRQLSIAETTVKKHITSIYRKTRVNNKIQLVNKIK